MWDNQQSKGRLQVTDEEMQQAQLNQEVLFATLLNGWKWNDKLQLWEFWKNGKLMTYSGPPQEG